VLARVKELAGPIEELKSKEVSETTAPIDGDRKSCRARECEMGNLVSDAILDRVKDQGVTIVFQNGGGLRASIDQGTVTMGEVLNVLPFQNTLATFQLTGKDVVASLEHGVSMVEEEKGAFPQVAGLKYSFDKSVAPNAGRIKSVEVMENGGWAPIDEAKLYTIATNNFTRGGGDGYELFENNAQNAYDYGPSLEQVVADYLTANRPYTPKLDGRITEVAEAATAPAETAPAEPEPSGTDAPADAAAAPAQAEPTPAAPAAQAEGTHTIVAGDTLWDIAESVYGDGTKWRRIAEANPGVVPRRLLVGNALTIPPAG
jgi:5'-nucleotidase